MIGLEKWQGLEAGTDGVDVVYGVQEADVDVEMHHVHSSSPLPGIGKQHL